MKIDELRNKIDAIDSELVSLLKKRLQVVEGIAEYKKENGLPIYDPSRECLLLNKISEQAGGEYSVEAVALFNKLMNVSRAHQVKGLGVKHPYSDAIKNASVKNDLPQNATVAFCEQITQGLCESLMLRGALSFTNAEGVLDALDNGLCDYGIISVDFGVEEIYERLIGSKLYIVKAVRYSGKRFFVLGKELQKLGNVHKTSVLVECCGDIFNSVSAIHSFGLGISGVESFFAGDKTMLYMEIESKENNDDLFFALEMIELESNGIWCLGTFNEETV